MVSQIDVQLAPEWALVGALIADVRLCTAIFALRLQLSSAGKRTFSYDVVWDKAVFRRLFGQWRNSGRSSLDLADC
ncbi:hypothetical protein NS226_08890 [Aureimonas ureilytica]|uniref:Uncharacterized protein n=1 Tax=Aureimonas ureilytica TaxID=401562 RepID=A0A175R9J1_9HYPH|nr:hypothetical protein NS226_08890 [Aureimonas ureilytica]